MKKKDPIWIITGGLVVLGLIIVILFPIVLYQENVATTSHPVPSTTIISPDNLSDNIPSELKRICEMYSNGNFEDAERQLKRLIKKHQNDIRIYAELASLYWYRKSEGDKEKAYKTIEEGFKRCSQPAPRAYEIFGMMLYENRRLEEAEAKLLRAIEIDPNYTPGYYFLAWNYTAMAKKGEKGVEKNLNLAEKNFQKTLSLSQNKEGEADYYVSSLVGMAEVFIKRADFKRAEEYLKKTRIFLKEKEFYCSEINKLVIEKYLVLYWETKKITYLSDLKLFLEEIKAPEEKIKCIQEFMKTKDLKSLEKLLGK